LFFNSKNYNKCNLKGNKLLVESIDQFHATTLVIGRKKIKTQSIEKKRFKLAMCQWESSKKNKVKNLATHQQQKTNKPKKMTCNMLIAKLIEIINNNDN
jgi:hypothetical protein